MKKAFLAAIMTLGCILSSNAQEITKTGLNFGPLPAVGYSSDLGWHYGALSDIYWYGDGSTYPEYMWKANVEVSRYSKGNTVLHSFFDSKYLIPGLRVSAAVSWFGNKTTNFYGFNGAASLYVPQMDNITDAGQGLYLMRRDIFRIQTCLQGSFGASNWGWAGGITKGNGTHETIDHGFTGSGVFDASGEGGRFRYQFELARDIALITDADLQNYSWKGVVTGIVNVMIVVSDKSYSASSICPDRGGTDLQLL